jgi:hypothetical protein
MTTPFKPNNLCLDWKSVSWFLAMKEVDSYLLIYELRLAARNFFFIFVTKEIRIRNLAKF